MAIMTGPEARRAGYNLPMGWNRIEISPVAWDAMLDHVLACLPEEGCGLLAGSAGLANMAIPVENQSHSPNRFRMAPAAQIEAMLRVEKLELELMAIFHSHPNGPEGPSATDLADAAYPELAYLVWTPSPDWTCRAFDLSEKQPRLLTIRRRGAGGAQSGEDKDG